MNKLELFENIKRKKSFLCVGLDTDIKKIPEHLLKEEDPVFAFNKAIIDATADLCIAYKPNLAFYESMGVKGWIAFEKTVKYIKENYPEIKIIILTTFDDDEYVFNSLKYGASGYLLKGVSMDELTAAIHTVHSGKAMINPDIATKVLRLFSEMAQSNYAVQVNSREVDSLTKTEWKVIAQVEKGAANKEIAETLKLSEGTVRNYLSSILNKLDLRDRTQLAIWAVQSHAGDRGKEEG